MCVCLCPCSRVSIYSQSVVYLKIELINKI